MLSSCCRSTCSGAAAMVRSSAAAPEMNSSSSVSPQASKATSAVEISSLKRYGIPAPSLPLDVADRHQLDDPSAETGCLGCGSHDVDILIGQSGLLGQPTVGIGADMYSALLHVVQQLPSLNHLSGLVATHGPTAAVGRGKEGLASACLPGKQVGSGLHAAADNDRLACFPVAFGKTGHARSERAGRPLAVHKQLPHLPLYQVLLQLRGVVGDVVDHTHPQILGRAVEEPGEYFADTVQDDLAVGETHVGRALHGRKVGLTLWGAERGAGQLPVMKLDPVFRGHD